MRRWWRGREQPAVTTTPLEQVLARIQADPELRHQLSGSDRLRFSGRTASRVRVTRIDHPGVYPGRYT